MSGVPAARQSTATILLVDDDPLFALATAEVLEQAGCRVKRAASGHEALVALRQRRPNLILLDIGLPDIDGMDLCQLFRLHAGNVPIVFLTAHRSHRELIAGFDAGADDYVTKPCSPDELLARVRAVLRRAAPGPVAPREVTEAGEVRLDAARHEAWVRGHQLDLSPKEFTLLWLLVVNAGRVVPRSLIIDSVWGADFYGDLKALDVYIRLLRRKVEVDPDQPKLIQTVRGVGYRFAAPETPTRPAESSPTGAAG